MIKSNASTNFNPNGSSSGSCSESHPSVLLEVPLTNGVVTDSSEVVCSDSASTSCPSSCMKQKNIRMAIEYILLSQIIDSPSMLIASPILLRQAQESDAMDTDSGADTENEMRRRKRSKAAEGSRRKKLPNSSAVMC